LSLATDLGLGQPEEHVLKQTVIATRLARLSGLTEEEQAAAFYVSLLAWVGCVADSHEMARWFGDDNQLRADSYFVDKTGLPMMRFLLGHVGAGAPPFRRLSLTGAFLTGGMRSAMESFVTHCQTTSDIADRLGLTANVCRSLPQAFARWDGKGIPRGLKGAEIETVMRIVQIADDTEVSFRIGGTEAALALIAERTGTEFDPELVQLCRDRADEIFADLETVDAWTTVIDGCAALDRRLAEHELSDVLRIFADYADLKSPWFTGHSRAVGTLAGAAASAAGLSEADSTLVERAGLVSRLGALGVSAGIWDKPGTLSASEFERVRTVPYLTERILCRQPRLAQIGQVAAMAHERMDGSGYPRGLSGAAIPQTARILAAAQRYQTLSENRPHREAVEPDERQRILTAEATAGQLDAEAVRAVLTAAGHQVKRRPALVAGLTAREVEVLELLVRGCPNKVIAERLSISARTVGSHIEHIYAKTGVTTRGAAAMFAMRHGLVDATATPDPKIG